MFNLNLVYHDNTCSNKAEKQLFSFSSFSRSFVLPENVASDKINADYKNGVLKLTLPKKAGSAASSVQHIKIG